MSLFIVAWVKVFRIIPEFRISIEMLNSTDNRFSNLYSGCFKTTDHLSFKLWIFSGHIASFKITVLIVQDFGNFELSPMLLLKCLCLLLLFYYVIYMP